MITQKVQAAIAIVTLTLVASYAPGAMAAAVHDTGLFTDSTLARNDDGSTGLVGIGFTLNYFGVSYSSLYVNNNGNVTFTGPMSTYTPFSLLSTATPIIAPFFGDVDTRNASSGVTQYGPDTLGTRSVFGVNWIGVGYYGSHADKLNSFQLIITDRSDIAAGDFDFEFNYDQIQWETGDASGGSGGLGGSSARAGWSNGVSTSFELAGSAINGALLDGGPSSLIADSRLSGVPGRYIFEVRSGVVEPPPPPPPPPPSVPLPATLLLVGASLAGLGLLRRFTA